MNLYIYFANILEDQWLTKGNLDWFESFVPNTSGTNNALESTNNMVTLEIIRLRFDSAFLYTTNLQSLGLDSIKFYKSNFNSILVRDYYGLKV